MFFNRNIRESKAQRKVYVQEFDVMFGLAQKSDTSRFLGNGKNLTEYVSDQPVPRGPLRVRPASHSSRGTVTGQEEEEEEEERDENSDWPSARLVINDKKEDRTCGKQRSLLQSKYLYFM